MNGDEYGEKEMKRDEGSSESPSLLPESQSTNKNYDEMMTSNSIKYEVTYEVMMSNSWLAYNVSSLFGELLWA